MLPNSTLSFITYSPSSCSVSALCWRLNENCFTLYFKDVIPRRWGCLAAAEARTEKGMFQSLNSIWVSAIRWKFFDRPFGQNFSFLHPFRSKKFFIISQVRSASGWISRKLIKLFISASHKHSRPDKLSPSNFNETARHARSFFIRDKRQPPSSGKCLFIF